MAEFLHFFKGKLTNCSLTFIALFFLGFVSAQTVKTDKLDYAPGETVQITGSGFLPGEMVSLLIIHIDPNFIYHTHSDMDDALVDANGNFSSTWFVFDEELNTTLFLSALGLTSDLYAETTFTDAINLDITFGAQVGVLNQGTAGNADFQVKIVSTGNPSGTTANLTISGLPAGATYNAPTSIYISKNGTVNFTLTVYTAASTPAGISTITLTASGTGYSDAGTGILAVNTACTPPAAPTSGGDQIACSASPIQTLIATATPPSGATVVWFETASGGTSVTPTWNQIGSKTYYAESQIGTTCVSTSRTLVTLTINQTPTATLTPGSYNICPGELAQLTITLTGTGTIFGSLSDGTSFNNTGGNQVIINKYPTAGITYSITALSNGTCSGTYSGTTAVTLKGKYTADAGADQTICPQGTASISGSVTGDPTTTLWTTSGTGTFDDASALYAVYTPSTGDPSDVKSGSVILTLTASGIGSCDGVDNLILTIEDITPPVLTGTIPTGGTGINACSAPVGPTTSEIAALYTDACGGAITVVKTIGSQTVAVCGWTVTYHYTINDQYNNFATDVDITYSGADTTAPSIDTEASATTVESDGSGNTTQLNDWLASYGGASASDANGVTWSNDFTGLSDLCGETGSATVIFTATDACGLTSTTTATFTIEDTTVPSIDIASSGSTVESDGSGNTTQLNDWLASYGGASASDANGVIWSNDFTGLSDLCGETGSAMVIFTATDACGLTSTTTATFTIEDTTVPVINSIGAPLDPVQIGTDVPLSAIYPDVSPVTAMWYFSSNGVIYEYSKAGDVVGNTIEFNNTAPKIPAGVYTIKLIVTDACDNSSEIIHTQYLVIYDPDGGFVTGGGWINSPNGALVGTTTTGKANFGFNAKYKTGKNNIDEVDGNTNFQFKEGNFHFQSSSHENMSLVISGEKKATYRGIGAVNGRGSYYFIVTVIDGDAAGGDGKDKFRIVVYSNGTTSPSGSPIYDNEFNVPTNADASTVIGGGSIVIHKQKGNGKAQEVVTKVTPIIMQDLMPEILETLAASPNPVVSFSTVRFSLKEDANVVLQVYDYSGRMIETLYNGQAKAYQNYDVDFQRRNLMSGIYIVKLTTDKGQSYDKRIIVE